MKHVAQGFHGLGHVDRQDHKPRRMVIRTLQNNPADNEQRRTGREESQRIIISKGVFIPHIGGLNGPQGEIRKNDHWRRHRKSQGKLPHHLGASELGQNDQHAPLAPGIDDIP